MASESMLQGVRERFDSSTDFTVGLEEEYQLLDPRTLALTNRFEDVMGAAPAALAERLAGELIASEIEFKTRAHDRFEGAARELVAGRLASLDLIEACGLAGGVAAVHPFSPWQDQRIIETPHYRRLQDELGYVSWVNNTWSIHIHCGVRGADRALAVCTAMRSLLPELLALSANSPVFLGRDTRLASVRTQIFTKSFPRCGIPDAYPDWDSYARHVAWLEAVGAIVENTEIWWSVRPHHSFGTVEVRICDGQTEMGHALGVAALALAYIARLCADYDAGVPLPMHPRGMIDENMWRAERRGIEAYMINLDSAAVRPLRDVIHERLAWTADQRRALGLEPFTRYVEEMLREGNGAQRQRETFVRTNHDVMAVQREIVERTRASAVEVTAVLGDG